MNSNDFRRVYTVTIYHNVTRQITHRDNPVSSQHALAFQIKHQTVYIFSAPVKLRSMHMDN